MKQPEQRKLPPPPNRAIAQSCNPTPTPITVNEYANRIACMVDDLHRSQASIRHKLFEEGPPENAPRPVECLEASLARSLQDLEYLSKQSAEIDARLA
jgi:hypothetical protein